MTKSYTNLPSAEYSHKFDELRQNRVAVSYHKYGSAKDNFGQRLVNALESCAMCIQKYRETHNTEYLCDAANYIMFEYMYPSFEDAYFKPTDSSESAGISGISIEQLRKDRYFENMIEKAMRG